MDVLLIIIIISIVGLIIIACIYGKDDEVSEIKSEPKSNTTDTILQKESIPTEQQRMAVFKTLVDLMIHNKQKISDADYNHLMYIGVTILGLLDEQQNKAIHTMNNLVTNIKLINSLDRNYQLSVRKMMYYMFASQRAASYIEVTDVNSLLNLMDSDSHFFSQSITGLPATFSELDSLYKSGTIQDLVTWE